MKAKLPLHVRVFDCDHCGARLDRDVNAAYNIAREAIRLHEHTGQHVAGLRPETRNADSRLRETVQGDLAAAAA